MDAEIFRRHGHEVVDWVADYLRDVERYPVLPAVAPGEIRGKLPVAAPVQGEPMEAILRDFREIILPGVTHWNHPRFFAYFPANNSGPAILAETIAAALGVNAMIWQSCPASTELEETVMEWLRRMLRLPEDFRGSIQDSASTSTLTALVCARERISGFAVNRDGLGTQDGPGALRIYATREAHSSVEKGLRIAGFGSEHLVQVGVDATFALDPADLERAVTADVAAGRRPCCVVATVGTTSSTAIDPIRAIVPIARRHGMWVHVDAAMAGSAAILPEMRWILDGVEGVDSFVFNPHKLLLTNFDCSAFFCRDPQALLRSMAITPEYLKTGVDPNVTNFRDWGIPLGRKFRALKLWFVLRYYGVEGLCARMREYLALAQQFKQWVDASPDFEVMAPVKLQTVCFRYNPGKSGRKTPGPEELERLNRAIMDEVNRSGRLYMTHTKLGETFCLRLSIGQTQTQRAHVRQAWEAIRGTSVVSAPR